MACDLFAQIACHCGWVVLGGPLGALQRSYSGGARHGRMDDDDFIRTYEGLETESVEEFIARNSRTVEELHSVITFLMHRRELLRDCSLEELEHQRQLLREKLADIERKIAQEELECFHDILKLHRQLREHDEPRD